MHIACRSPIWVMWVGADILESVYLRSFLTIRNLENFKEINQKISGKRSRITAWAFSYMVH